jgi:hypothetical protein
MGTITETRPGWRCRNQFPEATFVSPGLGPIEQETWHGVCGEAFRLADVIGVRAFAPPAYLTRTDAHRIDQALTVPGRHYPDKRWLVTQYRPDWPAARQLTAGPPLPSNVDGVVSFSLPR